MSSLRILRRRIRSVHSTKQITKAMEMVSAAKLRRAQRAAESARPYAKAMADILGHLARAAGARDHPLFAHRDKGPSLLVVVSADRGLCGSFNTNVIRRASQIVRERAGAGAGAGTGTGSPNEVRFIFAGRKAWDYFRRRPWPIDDLHRDFGGRLDLARAQKITDDLIQRFVREEVREIHLLYTRFISTNSRQVMLEKFLPIEADPDAGAVGATGAAGAAGAPAAAAPKPGAGQAAVDYIFEPSPEAIFSTLLPRYALTRVMSAMFESFAAEHAARMVAMSSASKNAEEMIEDLTLQRNRIRQATITKEIAELVGGAEALK
jgi:F-type H+-transporting ATPase subunit gamma